MCVAEMVAEHYGQADLRVRILDGIADAGLDLERLEEQGIAPRQLAAVDEFHMRGRAATRELFAAMKLRPCMHVLDVGSGLGGPARHMASEVGCRVTGIDLAAEYVDIATELTQMCGLSARVGFRRADAAMLPFPSDAFDAATALHVGMNIPDKEAVYREVRRVIGPGCSFGIYDILRGPVGEPHFPVPWADTAATSFLATPAEIRTALERAGFELVSWRDRSRDCRRWIEQISSAAARANRPPLGLHLLLGERFPQMMASLARNLTEGRVMPVQMICRARR